VSRLTTILTTAFLAITGFGLNPAVASTQPSYYPFGPQLEVASGEVLNGGWELCWSGPYNGFSKFSEILSACTESYIMYTGWEGVSTSPETFPETFTVLAAGPRSEVFRDTTNQLTWTVNESNGSYWSFGDDRAATQMNAVGFSDASGVNPSPLLGTPCFSGDKSICWHSAPTLPSSYGWVVDPDNPTQNVPNWVSNEPGLSPGWALNSTGLLGQAPEMGNGSQYTRAIFQSKRVSNGVNNSVIEAAKREAEIRAANVRNARTEISNKLATREKITVETFSQADIDGITTANLAEVEKEILALPVESRSDIAQILKIARKFEVVDQIASDRVASINSGKLIEIGLIPMDSKFKSSLTVAVKKLPASERSSYADIKVAIEREMAVIQTRKDRLAKLMSRKFSLR
jgi:hypothetical protein